MGRPFEMDAPAVQRVVSLLDVVYVEVDNGARVIELFPLRNTKHQVDSAAIEEGHLGNREQVPHTELAAVKFDRAIQIMNIDGDLDDRRYTERFCIRHLNYSFPRKLSSLFIPESNCSSCIH